MERKWKGSKKESRSREKERGIRQKISTGLGWWCLLIGGVQMMGGCGGAGDMDPTRAISHVPFKPSGPFFPRHWEGKQESNPVGFLG